MPVNSLDHADDTIGQYNRLSASQVITYDGCPRQWFYEKVYKFQIPQYPVMYVGKAVEEAFCRVLIESPFLIPAEAHRDTMQPTPLNELGRPSTDSSIMFPAQHLIPLDQNAIPSTIEELTDWAMRRVEVHFETCLLKQQIEWEKHPRKTGNWSSVSIEDCQTMVKNALRFHLEEIQSCMNDISVEELNLWRSGQRHSVPSPDGFGINFPKNSHPFAKIGDLTYAEAWEITRPWFVDPHAAPFSLNAIHPDFWFQGEYDLVYRWGGRTKIVDLKASDGTSFRSEGYQHQLEMYAMLWWVTHERTTFVDDLEIWYVGHPSRKSVQVPTHEDLKDIEARLHDLFTSIKFETPSINKCSPSPKPIQNFNQGGIYDGPSEDSRCKQCSWTKICPGAEGDDPQIPAETQLAGTNHIVDITPIGDTKVRAHIKCKVFSIMPRAGGNLPSVRIIQGQAFAQLELRTIKNDDPRYELINNLGKDDEIIIENAIIQSTFKGEINVKFDPWTQIHFENDELELSTLLGHRTRWNVGGKVAYTFSKSGIGANGKPWHRKGLVLFDNSGSIQIDGWENQWGPQYDMIEQGDSIIFVNISLDAWASQLRGDMQHNTSFKRL